MDIVSDNDKAVVLSGSSCQANLLVIVGPTGAGKSAAAEAVAAATGAHIISADSQQVYRQMDIGTSKPSAEVLRQVDYHQIDIVDPDQEMTAGVFVDSTDAVIRRLTEQKIPIVVVGGTGLYVRALIRGLFDGPPANPVFRSQIENTIATDGLETVYSQLKRVDVESTHRIGPRDKKRIIRALEVFEHTGIPLSIHLRSHAQRPVTFRYQCLMVGIAPERESLYQRINTRVDSMMDQGLVEEVEKLRDNNYLPENCRSQKAIGYAEMHRYLSGEVDKSEAVRLIQRNTRHYARRQLSWYRKDSLVRWTKQAPQEVVASWVDAWQTGETTCRPQ